MKLIDDTFKSPDGKWSRKSLTAFFSFSFALIYEFIMTFFIETKEYVFIGLLGLCATSLGLSVWNKFVPNETNSDDKVLNAEA